MFRKLTTLVSVALVVSVLAGPASAMSVPGLKHHVTGSISAVDRDSNTFTVTEDKTQKSYVFSAKDPGMLSAISKGEHVRVGYSKHGTQLIASKVSPKTSARASVK
jgi:hypothetical protein